VTGWAEFITARLGEDEAAAGEPRTWAVSHHDCSEPAWDPCTVQPCPEAVECAEGRCYHRAVRGSDGMIIYDEGGHTEAEAEHVARHDPARVLRQVQAMREILGEHQQKANIAGEWCYNCGSLTWPCANVRSAASIWSDHPDHPEAGR